MKKINCLIIVALFSVLLSMSSCKSASDAHASITTNNSTDGISIKILHAGGGYDGQCLLNAQETFVYYYEQGYRYFEYDLKLSTDGRIIASHSFEHLSINEMVSYDTFTSLKLSNDMTPVNEEWLINTIRLYPDIKIIVDAKMDTYEEDVAVLKRIEQLEDIYGIDLSGNIIPEIFSVEMWDLAQECTSFDSYIFSHYKEYYSVDRILEEFSSPKIIGVAVPTWSDNFISTNLYKIKQADKLLLVFTVTNERELAFALDVGADGIYID